MGTMKAHTEYLTLTTKERYEMVHLTPQVEAIVRRSGIDDGLCFVDTAAQSVGDLLPVIPANCCRAAVSLRQC